ncbi:hypothetical protein, partial [uncultured Clostridium sp.]|uniref:hypothetical protein n=2 Tax=Clostridium TaxID=1485 RepID=UPI0025E0DC3B
YIIGIWNKFYVEIMEDNMKKEVVLLIIIMIAMILNDIFMALDLVWYIELLPFIIVIIGYIIILLIGRKNKNSIS